MRQKIKNDAESAELKTQLQYSAKQKKSKGDSKWQ